MLIKVKTTSAAVEQQITDEKIYRNRRNILKTMGFIGAGALLSNPASAGLFDLFADPSPSPFKLKPLRYQRSQTSQGSTLTPQSKVTGHNNFYEFGSQKSDPKANAQQFKVNPWQLSVSGQVDKPLTLDYDDLFKSFPLQERIYRLRCVEAWSMVIPWIGFELGPLVKKAAPNSKAKFVKFTSLYDPKQMPGQANRYLGGGIDYPYVEGLTIAEAMHPLTILAVGLYGKTLPPQNGAPVRLIVPWKYGFKSIKSIVNIELTDTQPINTWQQLIPGEYGFYANVNPQVDHPRWSQASERLLTTGGLLSRNRIPTLMFNGYDEVAPLYRGLDLRKNY